MSDYLSPEEQPVTAATAPPARLIDWQNVLVAGLLIAIVALAAYFRFIGQNWDDYTHLHPDERFLTTVTSSIQPVSSIGEYFDTHVSSLNPNNRGAGLYVYGTLPLFVVKAAAGFTVDFTHNINWGGYNGIQLVGRSVSAVADLLTLLFVFLIGRRLYNRWTGLLAAALYAGAVLPIQLSHFWTTDAFTSLPVAIAFWFAVRVLDDGGWANYVGFGVGLGAAVASRVNVAPLAVVLALATLIRIWPVFDPRYPVSRRNRLLNREVGGLMLAAVISILVFRLAQPYAFEAPSLSTLFGFIPNQNWLQNIGEAQRLVSGQVDFPPNHQWASRLPYVFAWYNMVMWGMGLPLGLMAWGGWAWAGLRVLRGRPDWARLVLPFTWILIYFGWQGRQWVMTMRYYMPLYPILAVLAAWALMTLLRRAWLAWQERSFRWRRLRLGLAAGLLALVAVFTLVWAFAFTRIYTRQLTRVGASHWVLQNIPADYSLTIETPDGVTRLVNIGLGNSTLDGEDSLLGSVTRYFADGESLSSRFAVPITGTVTSIHAAHLGDPQQDADPETLWVALWDIGDNRQLGEGRLTADFSQGDSALGRAYDVMLDDPVTLLAGREYELRTRAESGAPFIVAGAAIATEGPWDDPIPWKVCALPDGMLWTPETPPGLVSLEDCDGIDGFGMGYYQGLELFMAAEDNETKRDILLETLDDAEYLTISSNRFYDTLPRLPMRFPMSVVYYDSLFSGELGFELIQTFSSTFTLGQRAISDQYLPTYDAPNWLNEWEAEEAFHVYDHPTVFIFRKTAAYDSQVVAQLLGDVELASATDLASYADTTHTIGVVPWSAPQASDSPTALMLPSDMLDVQQAGGTWSELYDHESPVNQSDVTATVAWWAAIVLLGWIAWPTLFVLLPGLADRAYPLAKITGLLVVSWLVWYGASQGFYIWSPGGIGLAMVLLALLSALLAWRQRAAFVAYLRVNWRRLLVFEGLTLLLFVGFVLIRLGNPDLWHQSFGGERPMDFAYMNAVLRSTIFPPYNPWYAGGFINYYYYGFVLLGMPVKLLGLVPAVGFNLILATLFALTGMGAFSAAFNIVSSLRRRQKDGSLGALLGSPWVAGLVAMLLAVILGNLDDIRILIDALARTGGATQVTGGGSGGAFLPAVTDVFAGIGDLFSGQPLNIATHQWYWNPTRVMVHTGGAINEIPFFTFLYGDPHAHAFALPLTLLVIGWLVNEVLIAGRVQRDRLAAFLALALGALAVFILRATNFADWVTYLVLALAGLTFAGYLRHRARRDSGHDGYQDQADIPLPGSGWRLVGLFGGGALYLGWHSLRQMRLNKAALLGWLGTIIAFVVLGTIFLAPYTYWYATADAVPQFWQGQRTPLWAYLDLNGVFLFLIISLLLWDTARYLGSIRVRQLIGRGPLISMILIGLAWLGGIILALTLGISLIAAIALPTAAWAALLFFRPGQSREMRMIWATVVLTIFLTFFVDLIVWAGDIGRQNTVFKFYMQVWIMLSVVGGAAFAWLLRASERWQDWLRNTWMTIATVLLTIAAMYPLLATQAKFIDRMAPDAPHTLDGMIFLAYAQHGENGEWFDLSEDYDMIRWLQDNVQGSPVILETTLPPYRWGSRVSMFTGLPTLVGYDHHQRQQRTLDPLARLVDHRVQNVTTLYNTSDIEVAWRLLQEFDVSYIVVGQLERAYHTHEGLTKFQRMVDLGLLDIAYEQGDTRVYAVRKDATLH